MVTPLPRASTLALLRQALNAVRRERDGLSAGALAMQCVRAARLVFFRNEFAAFSRDRPNPQVADAGLADFLVCLRYRHYLAKGFSLRQRVAAMRQHNRFEAAQHGRHEREAMHGGQGLALWSRVVDGTNYSVRLGAAHDNRYEGHLSAVLFAGTQRIGVMSFSFIDGEPFGLPGETFLFVTRNQSDAGSAAKTGFLKAFKQTMPAYSCLAAITGIAQAHGMTRIAVIKAEAQVAFERRYARSFAQSYGHFWHAFGPTDAADHAVLLTVPLEVAPIDQVSPKHRSRARHRREHGEDIRRSSFETMRQALRPPQTVPQTAPCASLATAWPRDWVAGFARVATFATSTMGCGM